MGWDLQSEGCWFESQQCILDKVPLYTTLWYFPEIYRFLPTVCSFKHLSASRYLGSRYVGSRYVGSRYVGSRYVGRRHVGCKYVALSCTYSGNCIPSNFNQVSKEAKRPTSLPENGATWWRRFRRMRPEQSFAKKTFGAEPLRQSRPAQIRQATKTLGHSCQGTYAKIFSLWSEFCWFCWRLDR